jgi:hypothetical protein
MSEQLIGTGFESISAAVLQWPGDNRVASPLAWIERTTGRLSLGVGRDSTLSCCDPALSGPCLIIDAISTSPLHPLLPQQFPVAPIYGLDHPARQV